MISTSWDSGGGPALSPAPEETLPAKVFAAGVSLRTSGSREIALKGLGTDTLVEKARGGNRRAFGELVRRYRNKIFALSLHLTKSRSDADDVTQEVFPRAFDKLETFQGRGSFYSWLYRITVRLGLNLHRDRARRRPAGLDDPRIELAVAVDAKGDPRRAAALRQMYARLLAALDTLSETLRSTVVLVTIHGMSHKDAAEVLSTNPATIGWRIHEARQKMRAYLRKPAGHPAFAPRRAPDGTAVPPPVPTLDSGLFNLASLSRWEH